MYPLRTTYKPLLWTLLCLACVILWDASGFDLLLARPWGSGQGFALKDNWFLSNVLHEGARRAAWLPTLWLVIGVWKPTAVLRRLSRLQRVQWAGTTLLALAAIATFKQLSHTSCPWDLAEFGGHASWVSHWSLGMRDGGPGRCFPAGHASAGFAFVSGYFALRGVSIAQARAWLAGALLVGFVLGAAQQLRGAHFMSHTLWTGWLCWTIAWLVDAAVRKLYPAAPDAPRELAS
ncbi:MAG: (acid phosphatase) superfamily protein-like protein [Ramlibacter sp.]|nr:(acid phosphatase) superfamily protein-like protein [Ramlibacter sp.]